jgi:hypothetical protein
MHDLEKQEPKRISSLATTFWKWIFPAAWVPGAGAIAIAAWLDLLRDPLPLLGKVGILGIWAGTSVLVVLGGRLLHHVWLEDDMLIVEGSGGRIRVPLEDVRDISETRFQKVKWIKLSLRRPTALGKEIRFAAPLTLRPPFADHPVVREIRERKRLLAGDRGDRKRLP